MLSRDSGKCFSKDNDFSAVFAFKTIATKPDKNDYLIKVDKRENQVMRASTANATWLPAAGSIFVHLLLATTTPVLKRVAGKLWG